MQFKSMVICFSVLQCAGVLFAGYTSQQAVPSAKTVAPTTVQTTAPTTLSQP
ncbi:MAG: hypothetical protein NTZ39_08880 [Methanoregula sp.]|nr:hypothetical protein [Methanoregula sp.]